MGLFVKKNKKTFCGCSMGRNQFWAGRVYELCVYYMTGTPEGSTESGFMEKPGTCDPWFTRHSAYPLHHGGCLYWYAVCEYDISFSYPPVSVFIISLKPNARYYI